MNRYSDKNNPKKINTYYTTHKHIKDSEIKIRVNKEQKKLLQEKAKAYDMSLSSYILTLCTEDNRELLKLIPDTVEIWNAMNDLYHSMESANNARLSESE